MKIRGQYSKLSPLTPLFVSIGLAISALPFRMYQFFNLTEVVDGFTFYKKEDASIIIMYVLCALAVIVPSLLTVLAKNIPASKSPYKKNKLLAIATFIFAGGIVLDVAKAASSFITNSRGLLEQGMFIFSSINQDQMPLLLEAVFGVFAAIYMIVFGMSYLTGQTTYSKYKFLAITPLFWSMSRMVLRFLTKISYVRVFDLLLELFMIAGMMVALLAFARICTGLSNKGSMRNFFAAGTVSIFFAMVANIPRLIMLVTANGSVISNSRFSLSLCDIGFALFVAAYIINAVKSATENDNNEYAVEEEHTEDDMATDDNFLSE